MRMRITAPGLVPPPPQPPIRVIASASPDPHRHHRFSSASHSESGFFAGVGSELRQMVWPSRKDTYFQTVVIAAMIVFFCIAAGVSNMAAGYFTHAAGIG